MTDEEILAAIKARVRAGRPRDDDAGERSGVPAPARPGQVEEAERIIGFPVPPLLRRLYLEVANGGVGPGGGGILGLRGGHGSGSGSGEGLLDIYLDYLAADLDPEDPPGSATRSGVLVRLGLRDVVPARLPAPGGAAVGLGRRRSAQARSHPLRVAAGLARRCPHAAAVAARASPGIGVLEPVGGLRAVGRVGGCCQTQDQGSVRNSSTAWRSTGCRPRRWSGTISRSG